MSGKCPLTQELCVDKVDAESSSVAMLDLKAGIHLKEIEVFMRIDEALHGARPDVTHGFGSLDCHLPIALRVASERQVAGASSITF